MLGIFCVAIDHRAQLTEREDLDQLLDRSEEGDSFFEALIARLNYSLV